MVGECVPLRDEFFAVVQLVNGTVIAVNLNQSTEVVRGFSVGTPRVFQQSILLTTANSTVVRSLFNTAFRDEIDEMTLLGAVVNGVGRTIPLPPPSTTTMEMVSDSSTGAIVGGVLGGAALIVAGLCLLGCV